MAMRVIVITIAGLALTGVIVVGLLQAGGGDEPAADAPSFDLDAARARLRGAPAPLASLHAQSSQLLEGGRSAFKERLGKLEGTPVVVNKWASWCGPCRLEFPMFQRQSTAEGKRVAFLGLNSGDSDPEARAFLRDHPVPYPSYEDPDEKVARAIGAPANYPITVFYDSDGKRAYVHQGGYRTEEDLAADIRRYAR